MTKTSFQIIRVRLGQSKFALLISKGNFIITLAARFCNFCNLSHKTAHSNRPVGREKLP